MQRFVNSPKSAALIAITLCFLTALPAWGQVTITPAMRKAENALRVKITRAGNWFAQGKIDESADLVEEVQKEIEEDQNTALGIVMGSVIIGLALIIASVVSG